MLPLLLALLLGASHAPLRLTSQAFGQPMEVEVRDLSEDAAREAIRQAFAEVADFERLSAGGGLAALNAAAGKGPQPADPRLLAVLARAESFCDWSEGAHGPLGRDLYAAWGLRAPVPEPPEPDLLSRKAGLASCDKLTFDPQRGTVALVE